MANFFDVDVYPKSQDFDSRAKGLIARIREIDANSVESVAFVDTYRVEGDITLEDAERFASEVVVDSVVSYCKVRSAGAFDYCEGGSFSSVVTISKKKGVMNPVAESIVRAASNIGIDLTGATTSFHVLFAGDVREEDLRTIASKLLANEVIEDISISSLHLGSVPISRSDGEVTLAPRLSPLAAEFKLNHVRLSKASDDELLRISKDHRLSLDLAEMRAIQSHFRETRPGEEPTDVELETIAQTWSEHCVHKTFNSAYIVDGREKIDNLFKETIKRATETLNKSWCVSVFKDNAGIVEFDDEFDLCFKVETHNHPSAIEPYGGAGTGIGGCIRDILGTGLGAFPIANTDVFCFASPSMSDAEVPRGTIHPRILMDGVVRGVRDYGNRMGIPTVNGALFFDPRYVGNPLVFCGVVGLIPKGKSEKAARKDDVIVVVGGRTGRDGIGGATFSSIELDSESEVASSGAVQIGNAITEKKVTDVLMQLRDENLYSAVTDCGAGGLSSACGEMGAELGVDVELSLVPLKYEGLLYNEIWLSEAQERMVLAVPAENVERVLSICAAEDVEARAIGTFSGDGRLTLSYRGAKVCDLSMEFLHEGLPKSHRVAVTRKGAGDREQGTDKVVGAHGVRPHADGDVRGPSEVLRAVLSNPSVASKHWITRQYDHEVQGMSVVKPFTGVHRDSPTDGAVLYPRPETGSFRGVAIGCGMRPSITDFDAYKMATVAIDEALSNVVALGADPSRVAILDNFCWGSSKRPDALGDLVMASKGCHDAAVRLGLPFISGKDSLNNEFVTEEGETISIPGTLLISALGIVPDIRKARTSDFKQVGSSVFILGVTKDELAGSVYEGSRDERRGASRAPESLVDSSYFAKIHEALKLECVLAVHDLSEGGLAVAVSEMCFGGDCGVVLNLDNVPCEGDLTDLEKLFSESCSRFLVEVRSEDESAFLEALSNLPAAKVAEVYEDRKLVITSEGKEILRESVDELKAVWLAPLDFSHEMRS
ncbi:MAG: phosphoribosylformylglycinamidine synthase subunit PurL [Planctomycetes bacterium]|nr:phosphoribosylformylglycinamidine synthase subunit PurL [Planctomycetota bacterium]